jgi:hypothetical protein
MSENKSKIINDDDYAVHTIFNEFGQIDPYHLDPNRVIASKARLWSKDFEAFELEKVFKEYIDQVISFSDIYFAYFVFEGVLNNLIKRREVYKIFKKKEDSYDDENVVNNIANNIPSNIPAKKTINDYLNIELDDYDNLDDVKINLDYTSSRTRRLISRKEGKKKDEKCWEDTCYLCGEHGKLICCEACEHVAHVKCLGLRVNFI